MKENQSFLGEKTEWFCVTCSRQGNLTLLKWAKDNGFKLDSVKEIDPFDESEEGDTITSAAALGGHLEVLKFAKENTLGFNENVFNYSAKNGHFDSFKWARENEVPFDSYGPLIHAAAGGYIPIIEYCKNNEKDWEELPVLPLLAMRAAENGRLEALKWIVDNKLPLDDEAICSLSASRGHLDVLKYARSIGLQWDAETCKFAAESGHKSVIIWARENGCEWDESVCAGAAEGGKWDLLKWLREEGAEWNERVCASAGYQGNLEMLKWARNNGAPWNSETATSIVNSGSVETLKWAIDNNVPFTKAELISELAASSQLNVEIIKYLVDELGCDTEEILRVAKEEDRNDIISLLNEIK